VAFKILIAFFPFPPPTFPEFFGCPDPATNPSTSFCSPDGFFHPSNADFEVQTPNTTPTKQPYLIQPHIYYIGRVLETLRHQRQINPFWHNSWGIRESETREALDRVSVPADDLYRALGLSTQDIMTNNLDDLRASYTKMVAESEKLLQANSTPQLSRPLCPERIPASSWTERDAYEKTNVMRIPESECDCNFVTLKLVID
jgi:hypothetical protein